VGDKTGEGAHVLLEEFDGHPIARIDVNGTEYERYRARFSADPSNAAYFELLAGTGKAIRDGYLN
jgi:hypothetical protein